MAGFLLFLLGALLLHEELLVGFHLHGGAHFLLHPLEEDEEHGHGEEDGGGADNHASDDTDADGAVTVGTGTAGEDQGQHAEHTGEHGHQNRAQTGLGGGVGCFDDAHALAAALQGELGDEDGRLGQQTDEHDDTRLEVDVVLHLADDVHVGARGQASDAHADLVPEPCEAEAAHQAGGHGEDDGERHEERLVEAGEDEEDEDDADGVDEDGLVGAHLLIFLARDAAVLVGDVVGQGLSAHLVDGGHGVGRGVAHGGLDHAADLGEEVEVLVDLGTEDGCQLGELGDGCHAGAAADVHIREVSLAGAVLRVGLEHDAIDLTELVEVRGVAAAEVAAHGGEHLCGRDAGELALGGIDGDLVLGEVAGVGSHGHLDLGPLAQHLQELLRLLQEEALVAVGAVLQVEVHIGAEAVAGNHTGLEAEDLCLGDFLHELAHEHELLDAGGVLQAAALAPVLQAQDEHTVGGTLTAHHAVAGGAGEGLDVRVVLDDFLHAVEHALGVGQVAARRTGDVHHEHTLVLLGHQALGQGGHEEDQQHHGDDQAQRAHPAVVDDAAQVARIVARRAAVNLVIDLAGALVQAEEEAADGVLGHAVALGGAHQHGAQSGADHEGRDAGDTHGHGQRDTELGVEHTAGAAHHRHGDEHGHEDERTGDDGHGHVRHGVLGGLVGRGVARIELCLNSLHHHDGVVHHRTDGQHEGEERQQVQREARSLQGGKGADEGDDDRDRRYQRGAEVLQEEVHHEDDQQDGDDERLLHIGDGLQQEVVGRHHLLEVQALRQRLLHLAQGARQAVVGLLGVRTRELEGHEGDGGLAVELAAEAVVHLTHFQVCHVAQTQQRTVGLGHDDNVAELLDLLQAAGVAQGVLIDVVHACAMAALHGFLAQTADGGLQVLLGQAGGDVAGHEAVLGHDLRLQPYTQGVVGCEGEHLTHALDTLQLGSDVDGHVVAHEVRVVLRHVAHHGVDLKHGGLALEGGHTDHGDFLRQQTLRHAHAVLGVHGRHVRVGALLEEHRNLSGTRVGGGGGHVGHVLHTVDTLFQGLDDGLGDRLGRGAGIGGADHDRWRSDVRELLHRKVEIADGAEQDDDDGYGHGHHRALDKYVSFHIIDYL